MNDTVTAVSSNVTPSPVVQAIWKNYQLVNEDFRRIAMDPSVDTYIKEICSLTGKSEPKIDKQTLGYKIVQLTIPQHRILTFIRLALIAGKEFTDDQTLVMVPMIFKAIEKASAHLCTVTGRLHGLSLRKVRYQVLDKVPIPITDKEKLGQGSIFPGLVTFLLFLDKEGILEPNASSARAKEEVEVGDF